MLKSRITETGQQTTLPTTPTGTKDDKATRDNQTRRSAPPSQFSPLLARRGSTSSLSSEGSSSSDADTSGDESDAGSMHSFRRTSFSSSDSRASSPRNRYFDSQTSLSELVTEEFDDRHLATSDEDAKSKAKQRLTDHPHLTNSTVVVLSGEDKNTLRDELKFRNETGHFNTSPSGKIEGVDHRLIATDHNPPSKPGKPATGPVENHTFRTNHPYRFYNMKKGDSEPVEDSGHLLYNVAENGHTRIASHLTGIDPVNLDEDGKATRKPGYEQYSTELRRMADET
ncbi:hypothetical protein [Paraburkholderia caribensis]|uniref:hypothetical protein n=1 Tax=Paraburkholderia caribensis TaxID=75105 RepID=UPI001CACC721|nr:hypothetical protein [Paraburkholderia caribensis]CAG9240731.1 conserved hypothetical protein [Paraburkholderia caribensis]